MRERFLVLPPQFGRLKETSKTVAPCPTSAGRRRTRRYHSIVDKMAGLAQPRLDDAQYIIAREHGYGGWQKLKEHLYDTNIPWNC